MTISLLRVSGLRRSGTRSEGRNGQGNSPPSQAHSICPAFGSANRKRATQLSSRMDVGRAAGGMCPRAPTDGQQTRPHIHLPGGVECTRTRHLLANQSFPGGKCPKPT
jgi:hypothetical protein